jgi:uncharacterized membrane protein (UPF0127 family)
MPKTIVIENKNRKIAGDLRIKYCDTFLTQLRGLTFRSALPREEGLLLAGKRDSRLDSSIHMLFVPFDLSVIWINAEQQVVDKVLARAWRPVYFPKQPAKFVLEIHPERWADFEIGDGVEFKDA